MIIASIGMNHYIIKDLESAQQLLHILGSAQQVAPLYLSSRRGETFHKIEDSERIEIRVAQDKRIMSQKEAILLRESESKTQKNK